MSRPMADAMTFIGLKNTSDLLLEVGGGAADTLTGIRRGNGRSPSPLLCYLTQKEEAEVQKQIWEKKDARCSLLSAPNV